MSKISSLVSTKWLATNIGDPTVRVLDGSWHLPNSGRNAKSEYAESHIPSGLFFDVDEIADLDVSLPHMMPNNEKMSSRVRAMGISNTDHIIIYDNSDFNSAARTWFMFKSFGHANVSILDGGYKKWNAEDRTTESEIQSYNASHYTATKIEARIRSREDVLANIDSQSEQLVDARSNGRFMGTAPEPRPESRSGRIPGSFNVPFNNLINVDGTYKSHDELKSIFEENKIDLSKPIITSCGSGITACVLIFALELIGKNNTALYDGSWTEWGCRTDTPIEK